MKIEVDAVTYYGAFDEILAAVRADYPDKEQFRAAALLVLNVWRGNQRRQLGLTDAWGQELVYSGKMMQAQRWGDNPTLPFPFPLEADARGITNEQMAELIVAQGAGWLAGSDTIEAGYITARAAIEAAADADEIAAVLVGLA